MSLAFNSTTPNLNYAVNRLNRDHGLLSQLVSTLKGGVSAIVGGAGSIASNAQVEAAVQWAIAKANRGDIGYSRSNRNLKNVDGMFYDCSSFVITAFYAAGVDVDATYTGDMRVGFVAAGWKWIAGTVFYADQLQRGDILLRENQHTQMYIGNNQDVQEGNVEHGAEIITHAYDFWGDGWDGILRYEG